MLDWLVEGTWTAGVAMLGLTLTVGGTVATSGAWLEPCPVTGRTTACVADRAAIGRMLAVWAWRCSSRGWCRWGWTWARAWTGFSCCCGSTATGLDLSPLGQKD